MLTAGCWGRPQPEEGDTMSQRYTAVFEWDGEVPAVGAGDGWLGGRLVRLSFEEDPVGDGESTLPLTNSELFEAIQRGLDDLRIQAAHRDLHEVVINDVVYRTTNKKLVAEIQELRAANERQSTEILVHRTARAMLRQEEAAAIVTDLGPWPAAMANSGMVPPEEIVRRIVEASDRRRAARPVLESVSPVFEVPSAAPAPDVATLEEEHRYLSSALLSRCGPRAIGETWVDYARRCMGQS